MGIGSEFLPPCVTLQIDPHITVPCLVESCTCGNSKCIPRPSPTIEVPYLPDTPSKPTPASENTIEIKGSLTITYDAKRNIGTPPLQITFIGREHIDIFSREGSIPTTETLITITQTQPYKPWIPGQTTDMIYYFTLPIPTWLPPTATPTWGTIDYRIIAKFLIDESYGHVATGTEYTAQKKLNIFRSHYAELMVPSDPKLTNGLTIDGNKSFEVGIEAPTVAYMDSGSVQVGFLIKPAPGATVKLEDVTTVKVVLMEFRKYTHMRLKDGKPTQDTKIESVAIGESKTTFTPSTMSSSLTYITLPYASGSHIDPNNTHEVPIIAHPRLSSPNIDIMHQVVVSVYYSGSLIPGDPEPGRGGLLKGLKKMMVSSSAVVASAVAKVESRGVLIKMLSGLPPSKLGK
ncbi:hypothetical protein HDU76_004753 [Blyttiomyces sp. JEL0837]|nr:hypothetical protein HDU76_004753 [Blyttiomyces sp. JEL0837]